MRYLFGDIIPDEPVGPRDTREETASSRDVLSPVPPHDAVHVPVVPLRGRLVYALHAWWRSGFAAVRADPANPDAGVHYLCPMCLPLTRGAPQPVPCAPSDEPTSIPLAHVCNPLVSGARRAEVDDDLARHILGLRQVFGRSAMIDGVTRGGHRGIELARGSAIVHCRACGQDLAHVADLAGATAEDEALYEYTFAGLRTCPAMSTVLEANDGEGCDDALPPPTPIVLARAREAWLVPRPAS